MTTKNAESSQPQGEGSGPPPPPPGPPPGPPEHLRSRGGNTVFKSGPLFIASKGIGWTSWKKRWFILTRTSLVFFRSDPSAIPQKGSEVNLTLGGIDLNNSGSVVVKADKKLLTVLFPDGRDGRAFTLKAETLEDLCEWKTALENALAQAPSATHVMGQNGIFRNDQGETANGSSEKLNDKVPVRSTVIGTPILLALEDVDGAPSFLEKSLRFVEEHGVKVEGILRQAADVDDVEHRIREYDQGKIEFSSEEDPHVIADCVKYVLRELPSSPVPASCCNALLEACRTDRGGRVNAMRLAICETFPEPNRRLLQRILTMMQNVASHKAENRMSSSAVAACMAPLLLRPLLAGDCEIETDFNVGGDGSVQLLQAAAAANHAQAIVITLLEEYDKIFGEGSLSPELYSDTEESGSESEDATDDDESYEDDENDDGTQESEAYTDDDFENASSATCNESGKSEDNDLDDDKSCGDFSSGSKSPKVGHDFKATKKLSSSSNRTSLSRHNDVQRSENITNESNTSSTTQISGDYSTETNSEHKLTSPTAVSCIQKSSTLSNGPGRGVRHWGRTSAKKNLSMESIDYPIEEEEVEIQRLEATKFDLQTRVAEEVKGNEVLQASLERRKKALHEHRLALEKDVARLQDQLKKERNKRTALEAGIKLSQETLSLPVIVDEKMKAELQEIALAETDVTNLEQTVDDLGEKLNQERGQNLSSMHDSCNEPRQMSNYLAKLKDKQKDIEAAATSNVFERSSKDTGLDGTKSENEKKQESTRLQNKTPPQYQQPDPLHNINFTSDGMYGNSSAAELAVAKPVPTNSKRSGTRGEGSNSTNSALTKLTTRLNFLKERRSQITNELQNMDKGRGSGHAGPTQDKVRGSEPPYSVQYPDKGQGSDSCQSVRNPDKGAGIEGESLQNSENYKKSGSKSHHDLDGGRRSEGQHPHILDRGISEGKCVL